MIPLRLAIKLPTYKGHYTHQNIEYGHVTRAFGKWVTFVTYYPAVGYDNIQGNYDSAEDAIVALRGHAELFFSDPDNGAIL